MKQNMELYDSSAVWDQEMQLGQKNLIRAIADFFPAGIFAALDVGCGDGKITRAVMKETGVAFTGLDASEEALKRCDFASVLGDAANLPFPDARFDLVMSTDTLEHLSDEAESRAWSELFRVAGSWVAVAVPFRENLLDAHAKCPECGTLYHVNWHMRSYDWRDLVFRIPEGWIAESIVLSGEEWSSVHPLEIEFRCNLLDEWSGWEDSVCPVCGRRGTKQDKPRMLSPLVAGSLGGVIYSRLRDFPEHRTHNEVLVFFRKAGRTASFLKQPCSIAPFECFLGEAFFNFSHEKDLSPYPQAARVVDASDGGVIVQFPVYGQNDILELVPETVISESFEIVVEDALGLVLSGKVPTGTIETIEIPLPRKVIPGYYGLLLRLPERHGFASACFGGKQERRFLMEASGRRSQYFSLCADTPCPIYVHVRWPMSIVPRSLTRWKRTSSADWRSLFEGIETLEKERNQETRNVKDKLDEFSVHLQNLRAERDALLERAKEADARAVEVQNLRAERDALLERAKEADAHVVEVQNLMVERETLKSRLENTLDYRIRAFWGKTGGGGKP